jgi:MoaA/NifB/PqqE/SkfB family radical SAM enzyme
MRVIDLCPTPRFIVWDITFACPLRCTHCYSESGRRASRQLDADDLFRVTDAMIAASPRAIILSGGEPLLVPEIFAVAERMVAAGVAVILYTSGSAFNPRMLPQVAKLMARVTVSIDGATAEVHDRIRGRAGSFGRAMDTLAQLDRAICEARRRGERTLELGVDYVVMQYNFDQIREFCLLVSSRFPELSSISFGSVSPTGLASRPDFEGELLEDEQVRALADGRLAAELQALVPPSIVVSTTDNRRTQLHPDVLAASGDLPPLQVEPDGLVRAMPLYEGTVGSLLKEPLAVLWERAIERWSDPFVVETLRPATTMRAWAEATRSLDQRFASADDLARIARRPPYMRHA